LGWSLFPAPIRHPVNERIGRFAGRGAASMGAN
jgi:hypothetical protein